MAYAADHDMFTQCLGEGACQKAAKTGLLRRLIGAVSASRQRSAEREVARFIASSGGRLTDDVERRMMRHVSRSTFGALD